MEHVDTISPLPASTAPVRMDILVMGVYVQVAFTTFSISAQVSQRDRGLLQFSNFPNQITIF